MKELLTKHEHADWCNYKHGRCECGAVDQKQPKEATIPELREWLIRKRGYYYRPNRAGYTASVAEAGRYTKAEAENEAALEPWHMAAVHESAVSEPRLPSSKNRSHITLAGDAFVRKFRREPSSMSDAAWLNGYVEALSGDQTFGDRSKTNTGTAAQVAQAGESARHVMGSPSPAAVSGSSDETPTELHKSHPALHVALCDLSQAIGNPALEVGADSSFEVELIKEATRRFTYDEDDIDPLGDGVPIDKRTHQPAQETSVPLTELQQCLASEGAKDYRIEALEAALDWALPAVFGHYTEGDAPKTPGAYEEIEKGRARVLAELERLRDAQPSENGRTE